MGQISTLLNTQYAGLGLYVVAEASYLFRCFFMAQYLCGGQVILSAVSLLCCYSAV